jgi:U3 small nucleolar RNA-associated protein 25
MKHDKYLKKQKSFEKAVDSKSHSKKKPKEIASAPPAAPSVQEPSLLDQEGQDDDPIDGGIELNIDDLTTKEDLDIQDSGYTRPRILILCPFRSTALEIVTSMRDIFNVTNALDEEADETEVAKVTERTTIKNWEKFQAEYSLGEEEEPVDNQHKPSDWQSIFVDNLDDEFKMGVQINPLSGKGNGKAKGAHMRLFTDFYHADIIIASPLGLRLTLENNQNRNDREDSSSSSAPPNRIENDYLSSLEMIYLHQADVLLMQNWSHVEFILQNCNQLPHNKTHATIDFTRIRPYFLDNLSSLHRQVIISSQFHDPIFNTVMRQHCASKAGQIKIKKQCESGCLSSITIQVKQIFNILPISSFLAEEQERFQYFCSSVLTPLLRLKQSHTLIMTPSYLHFVRVRNELLRREVCPSH